MTVLTKVAWCKINIQHKCEFSINSFLSHLLMTLVIPGDAGRLGCDQVWVRLASLDAQFGAALYPRNAAAEACRVRAEHLSEPRQLLGHSKMYH